MSDTGFRNLALLDVTASTARVLNLRHASIHFADDPDLAARPFFSHPALNRAIIIKHQLRANELDAFGRSCASATKVILPIDHANLRAGAKYFFIGQNDYASILADEFGFGESPRDDRLILTLLAEAPSFDPFLLREQMRRSGYDPAPCYFNVSPADTARMLSFAQDEIQPLVDIAFAGKLGASEALARKLLSNAGDSELAPLRHVLMLDAHQFAEGVFCWKAFLYYKWKLIQLRPNIERVTAGLAILRPVRPGDAELRDYIAAARVNLQRAASRAVRSVAHTLSLYDLAYDGLIQQGNGTGFRDFLLEAPARFSKLGMELAAVDHMVSFWLYRFPNEQRAHVTPEELATIFRDFETGLHIEPPVRKAQMAFAS